MKKLMLLSSIILLLSACTPDTDDKITIKLKTEKEQKEMFETFTYDDYKKIFDKVVKESKTMKTDDEVLQKWIVRTLANEHMYYKTDLSAGEVIQLSKKKQQELTDWINYAKTEYGVSATSAEIDNYLKEGPDKSKDIQHKAFAEALGLTLKELNHTFDRDLYEKNVIWLKLRPKLENKYGTSDNNVLIDKYEKEVK